VKPFPPDDPAACVTAALSRADVAATHRLCTFCSVELLLLPEGQPLPVVGLEVQQVWVGRSLRLVFDSGEEPDTAPAYLDVTDFGFIDADGFAHELNVETDPGGAGRVLSLLHQRVTAASVIEWQLELSFDNGATLLCPPHPKFEAWVAIVPGSGPLFCPPAEHRASADDPSS
jgi:hypothetical protein